MDGSVSPGVDFKQGSGLWFMNINEDYKYNSIQTNQLTHRVNYYARPSRVKPIYIKNSLISKNSSEVLTRK